jgi:BirA family biotin operon repressor/biotin-[acetyl-CoA-carboxylase] ligase
MFKILTFDTLPSTQDEMRLRLERGENVHGLVIRALEQTSGRGRRARDWKSNQGGSYQTLAIRDSEHTLNKPYAAIAIAIGIATVIPNLSIKWPNDLFLDGKKLAGILCEYIQDHLLIGVGMNVQNDIPPNATRLDLELETVHELILQGLKQGLELLQITSDLPSLFKPYDFLEGKPISVRIGSDLKQGIARGIDKQGCLRLEQKKEIVSICSGHIGSLD